MNTKTLLDAIFVENQPEPQEIDFSAIAAMLCGKELTPEQKANVAVFNAQYDEATGEKKRRRERG